LIHYPPDWLYSDEAFFLIRCNERLLQTRKSNESKEKEIPQAVFEQCEKSSLPIKVVEMTLSQPQQRKPIAPKPTPFAREDRFLLSCFLVVNTTFVDSERPDKPSENGSKGELKDEQGPTEYRQCH